MMQNGAFLAKVSGDTADILMLLGSEADSDIVMILLVSRS
jgi:hypothetical protein